MDGCGPTDGERAATARRRDRRGVGTTIARRSVSGSCRVRHRVRRERLGQRDLPARTLVAWGVPRHPPSPPAARRRSASQRATLAAGDRTSAVVARPDPTPDRPSRRRLPVALDDLRVDRRRAGSRRRTERCHAGCPDAGRVPGRPPREVSARCARQRPPWGAAGRQDGRVPLEPRTQRGPVRPPSNGSRVERAAHGRSVEPATGLVAR